MFIIWFLHCLTVWPWRSDLIFLSLNFSSSVKYEQFSSVAQSCPTLCDPWTAACKASLSITKFELAQTHVHRVSDAIQPSHSLLSPSPPAFSLSQHQSFPVRQFLHPVPKVLGVSVSVLPVDILGWFALGLTGLISFQSKGLSRVFSNTTIQKHRFFRA